MLHEGRDGGDAALGGNASLRDALKGRVKLAVTGHAHWTPLAPIGAHRHVLSVDGRVAMAQRA